MGAGTGPAGRGEHWEGVYASKAVDEVSWYEPTPETSVSLVLTDGVPASVVDVGSGASALADELLAAGVAAVTLVDLSPTALAATRERLSRLPGERGAAVTTVVGDVLIWRAESPYDVWHDRAVFHFLTDPADRASYLESVRAALRSGGLLVVGTFAADGPEQCSGLPTARYTEDELAAVFGDDFETVRSLRTEHRTPWDTVQPFSWVVLRRQG
jgi:SAM-dependent methyltransferase